jgi:hypothetical protein
MYNGLVGANRFVRCLAIVPGAGFGLVNPITVGIIDTIDVAKIIGITPDILIFIGR